MTNTAKTMQTYFSAIGSALPTPTKFNRGRFALKRAASTEDEVHIALADSSNVMQNRRILTKTYGDTLYGSLTAPASPKLFSTISNSATTASTNDTANYSVNVSLSVALGSGTWTVMAWGSGFYSHSSADGIVRTHLQVNADAGTALTMTCPADPSRKEISVNNTAAGQTGTIPVSLE